MFIIENNLVVDIDEPIDEMNWYYISIYQKLSESFIEKYKYLVDWRYISSFQKLSEEFIEKYKDLVNWCNISSFQKLSEDFIEKYKDLVDWCNISKYQKLSKDFIEKYKDLVVWYYISKYQKLSEDFIEKYNISISDNNWLYKDSDFKLDKIKECNLYEVDGDYVIAYKGIRSDNYSKYNFQYKYFVDNEYESHCDFNIDNENSFGLSAWTLDKAKDYCNEKLIKVKIHKDDVGVLVHNEHKIRCTKFYVIEEI